jgi:hypothetical protein
VSCSWFLTVEERGPAVEEWYPGAAEAMFRSGFPGWMYGTRELRVLVRGGRVVPGGGRCFFNPPKIVINMILVSVNA